MSSMTSAINVQVNSKDKEKATEILNNLGLSMSALINMTLKQVIINNGIPFEIKMPKETYDIYKYFTKEELEKTAKELEYMKEHLDQYPSYDNWEDLKASLLADDEV